MVNEQNNLEQMLSGLSTKSGVEQHAVCEGSLAADLHAYYNKVGLQEGWLSQEYATPLSEQDPTTQLKNILAAKDVVAYWVQHKYSSELIDIMHSVVDSYILGVPTVTLEDLSDSQHRQWTSFMQQYQPERITPGSPKFREKNYVQTLTAYADLSEQEKSQDRLLVAVVTDRILENVVSGYTRKIDITPV